MRSFHVKSPGECPWRRVIACIFKNGGYAKSDLSCGPYLKEFPEKCPMEKEDMTERFRKGYDYAAGSLLRREKTPRELDELESYRDDFDKGMDRAIDDAVQAKLCVDDRV